MPKYSYAEQHERLRLAKAALVTALGHIRDACDYERQNATGVDEYLEVEHEVHTTWVHLRDFTSAVEQLMK